MFDGGGSYGNDLSTSAAVLADGTIAWPGPGGNLFGISPTGGLRWKVPIGSFVLSPAVAASGRIFVADMNGKVVAIDVHDATATVAWAIETGGTAYGSPALSPDDSVVYTTGSQNVVAVADKGDHAEIVWRFKIDKLIEVSPAVAPDGTVVIGTNDPYQYALNPKDGKVKWKLSRDDDSYSSGIITPSGLAYYGDHSATLYVVDVATGKLIRRTTTMVAVGGRSWGIWTSPAVDNEGAAFYGTRSGQVFGVGPTGEQLFDIDIGGTVDSYPALGPDGTMYIGSSNGVFLAVAAS
jgi:outer membrane protein assembly factor BamB